jgi:photosystem II PsbH protein
MSIEKFQPKKVAPLQYLFRNLNSEAGLVVGGWGTTPLMVILLVLLFVFVLTILQIANSSVLVEGLDVDWSTLNTYTSAAAGELTRTDQGSFTATATGIFCGLLLFFGGCLALIIYGSITYPADQD